MAENKEELLSEISQMLEQYRQEIPGRRRAWPVSIRERVNELHQLGLNWAQISKQTAIPYHTVLQWRTPNTGSFNEVKIVASHKLVSKNETTTEIPDSPLVLNVGMTFPPKTVPI